jgi:hypothetical protein
MPQPELLKQKKIVKSQQPQTKDSNTKQTRMNIQKISTDQNCYQCEETNCPTICQTETGHQQIPRKNADKFEYSTGGTNNAAKIPHQMSLFIKQHQT